MKEQVKIGGALVVAEREVEPLERREDEIDLIGLIIILATAVVFCAAIETAREIIERSERE